MNNKKTLAYALPIIVIALVVAIAFNHKSTAGSYLHESGLVFGTSYNITYQSATSYKTAIDSALAAVDASLSPFNEHSIITAVNNNESVSLNDMFTDVYTLARQVSQDTQGAFDITVAPLVNAWGFGFKSGTMPTDSQIDSLRQLVGYEKVSLTNGSIVKADPHIMLDCSAIAKGYGVDIVARTLRQRGVVNFMVEIGGEVVVSGNNDRGSAWSIGVAKPADDSLAVNQELQTVLSLTNIAMATSGNYRNFYYKDGRKYAHTIDPQTGRPVQHNILSATVLAPSCAMADAYATAFMVMGMQKAQQLLSRHPELMAYLIYNDDQGEMQVWHSDSLATLIKH